MSADRYTAYGEIRNLAVGTDRNREQYTGKEFDKEGGINLYYFGARYYDPVVGIWTSRDPMEQFWNTYFYVGRNPINFIDPWGMDAINVSRIDAMINDYCQKMTDNHGGGSNGSSNGK